MKKILLALLLSFPLVVACSSDKIIPELILAEPASYKTIRVQFSEQVEETSAETAGNYSLTPGRPSGIFVTSAELDDSDTRIVNLTLDRAHLPLEYTLTVNNVRDLAGNEIAADSEAAFTGNGKVAFVTTATGRANLSAWTDAGGAEGVEAADNICQAEADTAGFEGTFVAWISTDTSQAIDRLGATSGPWIRTDGHPLAEDLTEFYEGNLLVPLRLDPQENIVDISYVWTDTDVDGSQQNTTDCGDWTMDGGANGTYGSAAGVGYAWTRLGTYSCAGTSHLYCFQTGEGPEMPSFGSTGKIAFVTSTMTNGNIGGVTGANSICAARASAASLTGTFKAWISDSNNSAKDLLASLAGPWVLLNGVKVADDLDDLTDGDLFAPIYLTEMLNYADAPAWTGTLIDGTSAADTCDNWTDDAIGSYGMLGHAPRSDESWTEYTDQMECNGSWRIYCLEE